MAAAKLLRGVTRALTLAITDRAGEPVSFVGATVKVILRADGSAWRYEPSLTINGNEVSFGWNADNQPYTGGYTIILIADYTSGNVNRVVWHGDTSIVLVDYSYQEEGDTEDVDAGGVFSLAGSWTVNGASAYEIWLGAGHTGDEDAFLAWLRQPATDAASAAEAQMSVIQGRADEDHTRAGNDHTTAGQDHTRAGNDHTTAGQDHTRAGNDHTTATDDHRIAAADHSTATDDHTLAASDRATAEADHTQAASDHTQASSDHTTAEADHGIAASDHTAAAADHTQAGNDHSRAESDHTTAASDHSQAGTDHTRAEGDHATAGQDHTQAGSDHTTAAGDHTTAAADHTQAVADHAVMAGYDTRLGDVEDEVSQLGQKVDDLATGKYYGYFASASELPDDADVDGFAYVGGGPTYTVYNLRSGVWASSGITVNQSPIGNEEDIDQDSSGKLQFANRAYDSQNPDGMGYKILRKNASFASQVAEENTIYEIRYNFDLGSSSISIPSGCVLRFSGGSVKNGTIIMNNTFVESAGKCFDNISFGANSAFANPEIRLSWFAKSGDDCTSVIQTIINLDSSFYFDIPIIKIAEPIIVTQRSRCIRGICEATRNTTDYEATRGTRIEATSNFSANGGVSAFFIFSTIQGSCEIYNLNFYADYPVGCALYFSASLSGEIHDNSFRRFFGCALVSVGGNEKITFENNYIERCGGAILIGNNYDVDNLLNTGDSGASAMVRIIDNYIVYCNYGIIIFAGSDFQILRNCISHIACYAIYGKMFKIGRIVGNYFENSGRSDFWIDSNGQTDANAFTTAAYLLAPHRGEGNNEVTGWGVGDTQTRPVIFFAQSETEEKRRSFLEITYNTLALNIVRTNIGVAYANNKEIAGVDAFAVVGGIRTYVSSNNIPLSSVNFSHYGVPVAPKFIVFIDNSYDFHPDIGNNALLLRMGQYSDFYKGTTWLGSRGRVWKNAGNFFNNDEPLPGNFNYPDIFNSIRNSNNSVFSNLFCLNNIDSTIKRRGILFFRPSFNAAGTIRWCSVKIPASHFDRTSLLRLYFYNVGASNISVTVVALENGGSTKYLDTLNVVCKPGIVEELFLLIEKEAVSSLTSIVLRYQIPLTDNLYASFPYIQPIDADFNLQLYGENCDANGVLLAGHTTERPGIGLIPKGQSYFDTDLGKTIVSNGTDWVNVDGSALS